MLAACDQILEISNSRRNFSAYTARGIIFCMETIAFYFLELDLLGKVINVIRYS